MLDTSVNEEILKSTVDRIRDLFVDYKMHDKFPIIKGKLHPDVYAEFIASKDKLEKQLFDHDLGILKYHLNVGNNLGQAAIPLEDLRAGYAYHYITALAAYFLDSIDMVPFAAARNGTTVIMSSHPMSADSNWWINWADKSSSNERHNHPCSLTSVLYLKNSKLAKTIFYHPDGDIWEHEGEDGEIVLFPAWLEHSVSEIVDEGIRVTCACNLNVFQTSHLNHQLIHGYDEVL